MTLREKIARALHPIPFQDDTRYSPGFDRELIKENACEHADLAIKALREHLASDEVVERVTSAFRDAAWQAFEGDGEDTIEPGTHAALAAIFNEEAG